MSETHKRKRVLFSDEGALLLSVRESLLQTSQISPLIASNNTEIMAIVRTWQPDLLILGPQDIAATTQTLKSSKDYRDIPLIAVLEPGDASTREKTLEAGCDDWLPAPVDEMEMLNKVQDFVGLRFRKLPRYSHNAPALVTFKGKDFPSRSIDINRRMIFLESSEGLAPATGRNVQMRFQLTKEEPITCWGRVVKLMARKGFHDEKETIGMLIRFLDLPLSAQKRIDALANRQYENARLPEQPAPDKVFTWHDMAFYRDSLPALLQSKYGDLEQKYSIPPAVLTTYLSTLSAEEQTSIKAASADTLISRSIAVRIQLMDELSKFREGAPLDRLSATLAVCERMLEEIQRTIDQTIHTNDPEKLLLWSGIKCEMIRNRVEIESIQRRQAPFAKTLETVESRQQLGTPRWILWAIVLLLAFSLFINFKMSSHQAEMYREVDVGRLGAEGNYLTKAHVIKPGLGDWSVFMGNLGANWAKLSPQERTAYCNALKDKLKSHGVKQVLLFEPGGMLNTGILNDEIKTFR